MVDTGGALVVLLEAGSDVTVGLWCDVCLLPSVVEFSLVGLLPAGVSGLGTIRQCTEHPIRVPGDTPA